MYISFASGSQRQPHFQWNIGGVGSSGVGHVHFMYISCCLCIIFRVGYAKISRRRGEFQWNMGLNPPEVQEDARSEELPREPVRIDPQEQQEGAQEYRHGSAAHSSQPDAVPAHIQEDLGPGPSPR